jgi:hypothetical protein
MPMGFLRGVFFLLHGLAPVTRSASAALRDHGGSNVRVVPRFARRRLTK